MENNKNHILIVDDDDKIRNLLKDYLTENHYIVERKLLGGHKNTGVCERLVVVI